MLSVYDTMNGTDYYKLHYSYKDMPFIEAEHGPRMKPCKRFCNGNYYVERG